MGMAEEQFHSTMSELPEVNVSQEPRLEDDVSDSESEGSQDSQDSQDEGPTVYSSEKIIFAEMRGKHEMRIKIKVHHKIFYNSILMLIDLFFFWI